MNFLKKLTKPKRPVIVVSGLPRSGTSMMMKMLAAGGVPLLTDHIREADSDNPQGYYEFERVKKLDKGDTAWVAEAQGQAVKIISQLLKHLPATYDYKVIFMRRHMDEVLASQQKMLLNRGEDTAAVSEETLAQLFEAHLGQVMHWLEQQPHMTTLFLQYSDVVSAPLSQAQAIQTFLAADLDVAAMATAVDPDLYRNRQENGPSL